MDTYDQTKNGFAEFVGSSMKNGNLTLGFFNNALQFVYDADKEEKFHTLYLGSHKQFGTPLLDKIHCLTGCYLDHLYEAAINDFLYPGQPRHSEKPKKEAEIEDPEKQSTDEESPADVKKYKKQDTKFSITSHEEEDRQESEDSFGDEEGNGALIFDDNALDILDDEEDRHKKQKRASNRMGDVTQFLINENEGTEKYESKKGYERSIEVDNEGNLDDEYNDIEDIRGKTTQEILNKSVLEEEEEVEKTENPEEKVEETTVQKSDKAFFYDGDGESGEKSQTIPNEENAAEFDQGVIIPSKSLLDKGEEERELSHNSAERNDDDDVKSQQAEDENPQQNQEEIIEKEENTEEKSPEQDEGENSDKDFELVKEEEQEVVGRKEVSQELEEKSQKGTEDREEIEQKEEEKLESLKGDDESDFELERESGQEEESQRKEIPQNEEPNKEFKQENEQVFDLENNTEQQDEEQTKEEQEADQSGDQELRQKQQHEEEHQEFEASQAKDENLLKPEEQRLDESDFELERESEKQEESEKVEGKEETLGNEEEIQENEQVSQLEKREPENVEQTKEEQEIDQNDGPKEENQEFEPEKSQKEKDRVSTQEEEEKNLEEESEFELERENGQEEESENIEKKDISRNEQASNESTLEFKQENEQEKTQEHGTIQQEREPESPKENQEFELEKSQKEQEEKEAKDLEEKIQNLGQQREKETDFELERAIEQDVSENERKQEIEQEKEESETQGEQEERFEEKGQEIYEKDTQKEYAGAPFSDQGLDKEEKAEEVAQHETQDVEKEFSQEKQEEPAQTEEKEESVDVQQNVEESEKRSELEEKQPEQQEEQENEHENEIEFIEDSGDNQSSPSSLGNKSIKFVKTQRQADKNDLPCIPETQESIVRNSTIVSAEERQDIVTKAQIQEFNATEAIENVKSDQASENAMTQEEGLIESKSAAKEVLDPSVKSQKIEVNNDDEEVSNQGDEYSFEAESDLPQTQPPKLTKNSSQSQQQSSQKMEMNQDEVLNSRQTTLEKEMTDHVRSKNNDDKEEHLGEDSSHNHNKSSQTYQDEDEEVIVEKKTTDVKSENTVTEKHQLMKNSSNYQESSQKVSVNQESESSNSRQTIVHKETVDVKSKNTITDKQQRVNNPSQSQQPSSTQKMSINQEHETLNSREATLKDEEVTIEKETRDVKSHNNTTDHQQQLVKNSSQSQQQSSTQKVFINQEATIEVKSQQKDVSRNNLEKPIIKIVSEQGILVEPNQAKSSNAQLTKNKSSIGSPISSETVQNIKSATEIIDRSISEIPKARDFTPSVSETKFDSDILKLNKDETVSYNESEDAVIEKSTEAFARHPSGQKNELKPIINNKSNDEESYDEYANEGFESAGGITPSVMRNKMQDQESQSKFSSNFPPSKTLQNETIPSDKKKTLEQEEYGQDDFESQNASAEKNEYESSEDEYEEVELEDVNKTKYEEKLQEITEIRRQESEKKTLGTRTESSKSKGESVQPATELIQQDGSKSSLARTATPTQRQESHQAIVVEDQKSEKHLTEKHLTETSSKKVLFESFAPPQSIKSQQHSADQIQPQPAQETNHNNLSKYTLSEEQLMKITKKVPQAPVGKRRLSGQIRVRTKTPVAQDTSFTHQNTSFSNTQRSVFPEVAQTKKTEQDQKNKLFYEQFTKPRKEKSPHYPVVVAKMDETHNNNRNFTVSQKMGAFIPQIKQEELLNNRKNTTDSTPTKIISINKLSSSRRGSDNQGSMKMKRGSQTVSPNEQRHNNSALAESPPLRKKVHQIHVNRPFPIQHHPSESSLSCNLETEEDKIEKEQIKKNHHATQFYFKRNPQDAGNRTFHHHQILRPLNNSKIDQISSKLSSEREQQPHYDISPNRQQFRHSSVSYRRNPNEFENLAHIPRNKDLFKKPGIPEDVAIQIRKAMVKQNELLQKVDISNPYTAHWTKKMLKDHFGVKIERANDVLHQSSNRWKIRRVKPNRQSVQLQSDQDELQISQREIERDDKFTLSAWESSRKQESHYQESPPNSHPKRSHRRISPAREKININNYFAQSSEFQTGSLALYATPRNDHNEEDEGTEMLARPNYSRENTRKKSSARRDNFVN